MKHYNIDITKYLDSAKRTNIAITNKQWFLDSDDYKTILNETEWVEKLNPEMNINQRIILIRDNIIEYKKCEHCSKEIKFSFAIYKTAKFCSKSCARIYNNDTQIQTTKDKTKELYENSKILEKEILKEELIKIKSKNKNRRFSVVTLNRVGLAKSLDYYIKEDIEISLKAKMFLNDEYALKICKREECNNKVKQNKFDYCSVSCQTTDTYETGVNTYFEKTGFTHPHYNPEVIEKRKEKSIIKWGTEHPMQNNILVNALKNTKLERYGDSNYNNIEQSKQTNLERYGSEFFMGTKEFIEMSENTCIDKYGVRNVSQTGLFANNYKWKQYVLPSGKVIPFQGYEDKLLNELLLEFCEDEIITLRKEMPEIWYIGLDNKTHRYFPDAYIPKTNTIFEVKSEYTLNINLETNLLKFKAVEEAGYNFELKVY